MTKTEQKKKILEFISRGAEIAEKEYNTSGLYPRISGPLFEGWINEINILMNVISKNILFMMKYTLPFFITKHRFQVTNT